MKCRKKWHCRLIVVVLIFVMGLGISPQVLAAEPGANNETVTNNLQKYSENMLLSKIRDDVAMKYGGIGTALQNRIIEATANTISGTVYLPAGQTAPANGITGYIAVEAANSKNVYYAGFNIPQGQQWASYSVTVPADASGSGYTVRYRFYSDINYRGYVNYGYYSAGLTTTKYDSAALVNLNAGNLYAINMTLIQGCTIAGTIFLPAGETAPGGGIEGSSFILSPDGKNFFNAYFFIPAGSSSTNYFLVAPKDGNVPEYLAGYYFSNDYSGYFRYGYYAASGTTSKESLAKAVNAINGDVNNINLTILKTHTISGSISLPNNEKAPDGGIAGYISFEPKNDSNITAGFSIQAGSGAASYTVSIPGDIMSTQYRVGYMFYSDHKYSGYLDTGYFSPGGTTSLVYASFVDLSKGNITGINLTVLKVHTLSGAISLPAGTIAPARGIAGYVYAEPHSGGLGYSAYFSIPAGGNSSVYTVEVPVYASIAGYHVKYLLNNSYDGYSGSGYYSSGGTTDFNSSALMNINTGNVTGINMMLLTCSVTPADKSALAQAIIDANALLAGKNVGSAVGNVSQAAHDAYSAAIAEAVAVRNNLNATRGEVNAACNNLATAATAFYEAVNVEETEECKLAAGSADTFVIRQDGTLWAWGLNSSGQLGDGTTTNRLTPVQIMSGVKSVVSSASYTLAIKEDGSLWAWGDNRYGQLGDGTTTARLLPVLVMSGVRNVVAGYCHSLVIKEDGTLWGFGDNSYGQLDDKATLSQPTPVQIMNSVKKVAAGYNYSMVIKEDGTLWTWGNNDYGQIGDGTRTKRIAPFQVMIGVKNICATSYDSLAIKEDGTLWVWGNNLMGQIGDGTMYDRLTPFHTMSDVKSAALGGPDTFAVKVDGTLWAWGYNAYGQLGVGNTITGSYTPVKVMGKVRSIAAGGTHSVVVKEDGMLWTWGSNDYGQLGDGTVATRKYTPEQIMNTNLIYLNNTSATLTPGQTKQLLAVISSGKLADKSISWSVYSQSGGHIVAVSPAGLVTAINPGTAVIRATSNADPTKYAECSVTVSTDAKPRAAAGSFHSLVLKVDGTLWSWGRNSFGKLGDGTTTDRSTPEQIMSRVESIVAGDSHNLAVKQDGTLWAWGYNEYSQLGDGSTMDRSTPVQIMSGVRRVAAGQYFSLAVKEDGTLWAWGSNARGQLGDGTTTDRATPVQVMSGVKSVAAGLMHTVAIKEDGTVWTWGLNIIGQLGDGTTLNKTTPVQVLSGVISVAAGLMHSEAVKEDGTLWAWGLNDFGQLGNGTNQARIVPTQVMTGVKSVSAAAMHTMVVKEDGTLWASGNGILGNGSDTEDIPSPVYVLSGVESVAAGNNHTLAIKKNGTLWAWGINVFGELGDGSTTDKMTPIQIMGLADKTALGEAIDTASNILDSCNVGTAEGNVSQSAYDALSNAITIATAVNNDMMAAHDAIDSALTALAAAAADFNLAIIVSKPLTAKPLVQMGVNPNDGDCVGLFIGLENILDSSRELVDNPNVAKYEIEIVYDPSKISLLDFVDEAHLGQFTILPDTGGNKVKVSGEGASGSTGFDKLFFLQLKVTGSALESTSLQIKYLSVSDSNHQQISAEESPAPVFHRGKIFNQGSGTNPGINDAVAGLQYLAGLRDAGFGVGQVNMVNMASIVVPEQNNQVFKPNVKDIIALLQYLVDERDANFSIN